MNLGGVLSDGNKDHVWWWTWSDILNTHGPCLSLTDVSMFAYGFKVSPRWRLSVQVLKTSRCPRRVARELEKERERGRRKEKLDGSILARPNSCHFCSPCHLRHLWPPHISLRLNMVTADPAWSGGSSRSGRAVRSNGKHGEVMDLQATSYAWDREGGGATPKRMVAALA
jgi:hypothetical protein